MSGSAKLSSEHVNSDNEEQVLSLLLVPMVLPLMRQLLKDKSVLAAVHLGWACIILRNLMPSSMPSLSQAVASEIVSSGDVCLCEDSA